MKEKLRKIDLRRLAPVRLILLSAVLAIIGLHLVLRSDKELTARLCEGFVQPYHAAMARLCARVPFSVAEALICLLAVGISVYIIYQVIQIIRRDDKWHRVYITFLTLITAFVLIYAGECVFWGTYYYGGDFAEREGLMREDISLEELTAVTEYFARLASEYGELVERDENGVFSADREEILADSEALFDKISEVFPSLAGEYLAPKPIAFSRVMSYLDFTGFFFPFTGEANVNFDSPACYLASTTAHEISHQRGVAPEQEANFVAVAACLEYGEVNYVYSAALLAYVHLGNALHDADYDAWREIYLTLGDGVLADFQENRDYWAQFEGFVQKTSNTVYEGFLQSYEQELGLRSYGDCVDLIVNYYYPRINKAAA